jgi:copper chaperone CopZ
MKILIRNTLILCLAIHSLASLATEEVNVTVKGMVCSFCAQGIKKKFSGERSIASVDVNLDEKWVKLIVKDGESLADERIQKLISEAGYNIATIQRKKK